MVEDIRRYSDIICGLSIISGGNFSISDIFSEIIILDYSKVLENKSMYI